MSVSVALIDDNGNFNVMYYDEDNIYLTSIKWYASIYKMNEGYHIKYPDNHSFEQLNIKDIYIENIDKPYHNTGTLYIPISSTSVMKCIELWGKRHEFNKDYFEKK